MPVPKSWLVLQEFPFELNSVEFKCSILETGHLGSLSVPHPGFVSQLLVVTELVSQPTAFCSNISFYLLKSCMYVRMFF